MVFSPSNHLLSPRRLSALNCHVVARHKYQSEDKLITESYNIMDLKKEMHGGFFKCEPEESLSIFLLLLLFK